MFKFNFSCLVVVFSLFSMVLSTAIHAQEAITINPATMTKYVDGQSVGTTFLSRNDILITVIEDAQNIYYFTSVKALKKWAGSNPARNLAVQRQESLTQINDYAVSHGYAAIEENEAVPADLQAVVDAHFPPVEQVQNLWWVKYYDLPNFQGSTKDCPGTIWPSLGNFRNKPSSLGAAGIGIASFCDHRWFGGAKMHFLLAAYTSIPDLGAFNNRLESHISY